jgi:excisionase family DNA binding protein
MLLDHVAATVRDRATIEKLKFLLAAEPRAGSTVTLQVADGAIPLPESVVVGLRTMIAYLDRGAQVNIVPTDRELSLRDAASLLGASREFVRKLVTSGELNATRVGAHHRVTLGEILAYRERRDRRRRSALDELHEQSVELGAYDEPG